MGDSNVGPPDDRSAWEAMAQGPSRWEALGRAIKVERVARGWERKDLAKRSGISYPYLSEIETGKKRPSWGALGSIAAAFNVRPSALLDIAERWPADTERAVDVAAPMKAPMTERAAGQGWFSAPPDAEIVGALSEPHSDAMPAPRTDTRRAEILRELLEYLHQLPIDDLERLRELARALRA